MSIDTSELEIINEAFNLLAIRRIIAADLAAPTNRQARLAVNSYERHRRSLLRDHPWNFAVHRIQLTKNVTAPVWGYTNAYDLPDGITPAGEPACLRVLKINEDVVWDWYLGSWYQSTVAPKFQIEGRQILSDISSPLDVAYLADINDAAVMDDMFRDTLATKLAMEWAEALTASETIVRRYERLFGEKLRESRSIDGQEGIPDQFITSDWVLARY